MHVAIEAILALGGSVRAPLSAHELEELSQQLGAPVPASLSALYGAFGGQDASPVLPRYPMRLMAPSEVVECNKSLQAQNAWLSPATDARYFWSDDNSNWAGVFVGGPLAGTVHVLDHDEPDEVPRYRSIESFVEAIVQACRTNTSWFDMPTDYPSPVELAPALHAFDVALVSKLRAELARAPAERVELAILQVTPASQTRELVGFLDADTLAVRTMACRVMGRRDHAAAIPKLAAIAREDVPENPVIDALIALNQMTDPSARIVVRELRATADPGLADYFPSD